MGKTSICRQDGGSFLLPGITLSFTFLPSLIFQIQNEQNRLTGTVLIYCIEQDAKR